MILKKLKRMTATIINGIGILIDPLSSWLTDRLVDYINLPVLGLHGIVILLLQLFHKALAETWSPTAPKVGTKGYQRQWTNCGELAKNWWCLDFPLIFPCFFYRFFGSGPSPSSWTSLPSAPSQRLLPPPPAVFFAMEKLGVTMGDRMKLLVKNVDNIILFNIKIVGFFQE